MALQAVDIERAGLRTAAADLDAVAEHFLAGGFAEHAMVEFLAARGAALQQLDGAVDGTGLFVAGDQERDRSLAVRARPAAVIGEILQHRRDAAGDAALHVDRAAAIET